MNIGKQIAEKRKNSGLTQQALAEKLNVSFQAVSKWENGFSCPDIELIPKIATVLKTTTDALFDYSAHSFTEYDVRYEKDGYFWGLQPNSLCYEIMKLKPPVKPYRVLDIGCGEGKDAVFLARNGYSVTAFDVSVVGINKAKNLADNLGANVDFFNADIRDYVPDTNYDIIFSSGVFHYIPLSSRGKIIKNLKKYTNLNGINVLNVFVKKPFIEAPPDSEDSEKKVEAWKSGELFSFYHNWLFHRNDEIIFDCNSNGFPHKHCMDILIAEKI
ncbi:MAG: methyltransferase domain-containing protein [Clostridia bacterium]|nr:methyltransferase domain-containing protein [Clostridia bacterium]